MKPWVVDAKDIEPEDLDQFHGQLLHLNNQIADFLDPSATEEMLIIAPKGFGKTLLLKAKRQSMRQRYGTMLPERALVDKPSANPDLMSHREYGSVRETEAYWKALWSIALTLAVEKHLGVCPQLSGPLDKLVRNENLRSACDLFTNLLALPRDAYFAAFKDYVAHLLPVFRRIHSSLAMFVDNIDEYFEDFLAADLVDSEEQRAIYRSYWHFAQVGIALAARDLHAINNHVKIFASIRKEVFQRTFSGQSVGAAARRLRDRPALHARRSDRDHPQEHRCRAQAEPGRHVGQGPVDTVLRGACHQDRASEHGRRGGCRRLLDPPHLPPPPRHRLHRPRSCRDRPAPAHPRDRAPADHPQRRGDRPGLHHRDVAASAAVRPRDPVPPDPPQRDPVGRAGVPGRAVRPAVRRAAGAGEPVACHVFASMFKIGLLGYVGMHPETAELVQFFRHPGEVPLDRNDVLPDAEHFLVHPSLDLLIGGYNPDYFRHLDKLNVIGADRPWRPARQTMFVLKGDVRGSGAIFQDPVAGTNFPGFFAHAVTEAGRDLVIARSMDGDAALLVDPNPRQVVLAALALRQRLLRSDYGCEMRFGGDAGFVELAEDGAGAQARAGLALLVAARLEPHATPGTILVTGQFVDAWRELLGAGGFEARPVEPREVPLLRESDGRYDLAKPGGEAPMLRRLMVVDGPTAVG